MNKIMGIIMPYIIVAFVAVMQFVTLEQKSVLEALIIGICIGLWFLCLHKAEGTVMMKLGLILSIVIFGVGMILGFTNVHLDILPDYSEILGLMAGCSCIGLLIVAQNKPTLSMTYQYSYKNKRRRYF